MRRTNKSQLTVTFPENLSTRIRAAAQTLGLPPQDIAAHGARLFTAFTQSLSTQPRAQSARSLKEDIQCLVNHLSARLASASERHPNQPPSGPKQPDDSKPT